MSPEHAKLIDESHKPLELWEATKPGIMNIARKALENSTPALESMLREIETHDPNAEAGRYHLNRVGKGHTRRMVATFEGSYPNRSSDLTRQREKTFELHQMDMGTLGRE